MGMERDSRSRKTAVLMCTYFSTMCKTKPLQIEQVCQEVVYTDAKPLLVYATGGTDMQLEARLCNHPRRMRNRKAGYASSPAHCSVSNVWVFAEQKRRVVLCPS
jgi:hypothetical protein